MNWAPRKLPFVCSKGIHKWETQDKADKCCNGWIRMWVPFFYGCAHIERSRWYELDKLGMLTLTLIPVSDVEEIARLNSLVSDKIREKAIFDDLVEN